MELFFGSRPLTIGQGLEVVAVGVALLFILEVEKFLRRRIGAMASRPPA
jgi:hypothetical protein